MKVYVEDTTTSGQTLVEISGEEADVVASVILMALKLADFDVKVEDEDGDQVDYEEYTG